MASINQQAYMCVLSNLEIVITMFVTLNKIIKSKALEVGKGSLKWSRTNGFGQTILGLDVSFHLLEGLEFEAISK